MLNKYDELVGQCKSLNGVNKVHIAFGNTITPAEVVALHETLFVDGIHGVPALLLDRKFTAEELRRAGRDWINDLLHDLKQIRKVDPEPFLRRDVRQSVSIFTDGRGPANKTLVITLAGSNHRLMMPLPTFLQNMDASATDVLIVRDGTRTDYTKGLDGLATSIADLGAGIASLVDLGQYRRVVGLGISAGGLPTILIATQLNVDVLACGAGSPFDGRWEGTEVPPAEALKASVEAGYDRKVVVAYGDNSPRDRQSAEEIATYMPAEKVEVSIKGMQIEHNMLHPLSVRRMLPAFLNQHLGLAMRAEAAAE